MSLSDLKLPELTVAKQKNMKNLGYFERQTLINKVGKSIAKSQGWQIEADVNICASVDPRLRSYANMAEIAIDEIETYRNCR